MTGVELERFRVDADLEENDFSNLTKQLLSYSFSHSFLAPLEQNEETFVLEVVDARIVKPFDETKLLSRS